MSINWKPFDLVFSSPWALFLCIIHKLMVMVGVLSISTVLQVHRGIELTCDELRDGTTCGRAQLSAQIYTLDGTSTYGSGTTLPLLTIACWTYSLPTVLEDTGITRSAISTFEKMQGLFH